MIIRLSYQRCCKCLMIFLFDSMNFPDMNMEISLQNLHTQLSLIATFWNSKTTLRYQSLLDLTLFQNPGQRNPRSDENCSCTTTDRVVKSKSRPTAEQLGWVQPGFTSASISEVLICDVYCIYIIYMQYISVYCI